jgi:5-formyltetrahydrofolate cyclo-ligase
MPDDHHGFIPSSAGDVLRRRVKAELRKRMRGLRGALPAAACNERSKRICLRLASLEPVASARAVALFWPLEHRHEVDLRELDVLLRGRGIRVAYPAVGADACALTYRFVADTQAMQDHTSQGVVLREPQPHEPEAAPGDLDVVVVPALAVDPSGHRIGYGAGHYDRTLPQFTPPATSVVVAFDFQLIAEVPFTDGDVAAHYVVTDTRTLKAV